MARITDDEATPEELVTEVMEALKLLPDELREAKRALPEQDLEALAALSARDAIHQLRQRVAECSIARNTIDESILRSAWVVCRHRCTRTFIHEIADHRWRRSN